VVEPEQKPKWAQTTLQDAGDLVGDLADTRRTRSDFEKPPVALTATEPLPSKHLFLVQSSDPQSYGEAAGNPFWESAMQEEYNSLLENQTWDLVPLWEETCQMQMGLQNQERNGWTDQQIQSQACCQRLSAGSWY
jgi:hypothetical protein